VKTIILDTTDRMLVNSLSLALSPNERLVVRKRATLQVDARDQKADLVVVDCRRGALCDGDQDIQAPVVFLGREDGVWPQVLTFVGGRPRDLVLPSIDGLGPVVRAYVNNAPFGAVAALTVSAISPALPSGCGVILDLTIGSGFSASTVK
jgi:hypothetical protein